MLLRPIKHFRLVFSLHLFISSSRGDYNCQYPEKAKIQDEGRPLHLVSLLIESIKG